MPIHEFQCPDCGKTYEELVWDEAVPPCPGCGSSRGARLLSPTSTRSGRSGQDLPGPGDTACCGSSPQAAGCSGPGSCCGKG